MSDLILLGVRVPVSWIIGGLIVLGILIIVVKLMGWDKDKKD